MNSFQIKKYLFILLVSFNFTTNIDGFKVRKREDKNLKLIKDVASILKKYNEKSKVYHDRYKKINKPVAIGHYDKTHREGKRNGILVKRLVPSNYESKGFEYDSKYKTLYRPLVRIDKNNKITFLDNAKFDHSNNLLKLTEDFEIMKRPNKDLVIPEDGYLLQPFKINLNENKEAKILKDINNYVRVDPVRLLIKDTILRGMPKKYLVTYHFGGNDTRLKEYEIKTVMTPDHKLLAGQPHYGFWNYWTYDREILQDNCKGNAVQYGNICIQTPPH